ncbi:hypothetical protein PROFUN_04726 [Planoprotostelium fungivorum]|uniref:Uncharacterized protein n=1 Tax=Planoprotostelium fungivorum TaxID=1890364 RepID=A0A2P6NFX4_9EUKA|nr:hypothetical protein PROFUN_04726 [Planoprotostelium fungivorum]
MNRFQLTTALVSIKRSHIGQRSKLVRALVKARLPLVRYRCFGQRADLSKVTKNVLTNKHEKDRGPIRSNHSIMRENVDEPNDITAFALLGSSDVFEDCKISTEEHSISTTETEINDELHTGVNLHDLPAEILTDIAFILYREHNSFEDMKHLINVNRFTRECLNGLYQCQKWRDITIDIGDSPFWMWFSTTDYAKYTKSIAFKFVRKTSVQDFLPSLMQFTQVETVKVVHPLTDEHMDRVLANGVFRDFLHHLKFIFPLLHHTSPHVKKIEMRHTPISYIKQKWPSLTHLKISGHRGDDERDTIDFLIDHPTLTDLRIHDVPSHIPSDCLPLLNHVNLTKKSIDAVCEVMSNGRYRPIKSLKILGPLESVPRQWTELREFEELDLEFMNRTILVWALQRIKRLNSMMDADHADMCRNSQNSSAIEETFGLHRAWKVDRKWTSLASAWKEEVRV